MACTTQTKKFYLEASNIYFGRENADCITPITGLSGGESFKISSPNVKYEVWTSVNAVGSAPATAGYTQVEVAVGTAYTVAEWLAAFKTALETEGEHLVTLSTDGLSAKAESFDIGAPLEAITDTDSGFTLANLNEGFGGDLGKTKDGIEVTHEVTLFDVLSNQQGESLEDQIIQGTRVSVSATLLDVSPTQLDRMLAKGVGASLTPAGGTKVIGLGTSKNFESSFQYTGKLILHPIRLASSDRSEDFAIWKCLALPETINFDGTDTKGLSVSFNGLVDESKDSTVNLCGYGDWRQDLR